MLPHLDNCHDEDEQRPSLPSIRDLFGDQLGRPVKRPSPFSFNDLSSSLPTESQISQHSPALSAQCSLVSSATNSPRSVWSQPSTSSRGNHQGPSGWSQSLLDIDQEKFHSHKITLPPIYPVSSPSSPSRRASTPYIRGILDGIPMADDLPRRASEISGREWEAEFEASLRRRHTIASSISHRPSSTSISPTHSSFTKTSYPVPSSHPSLRYTSEPLDYSAPSPPSTTSGDEAPAPTTGERRKLVAKYECQYCGKMFNRPSSLKIHHNTHTGEKPFTCSFPGCGRSFSVMSNMRRHARTHGDPPPSQLSQGFRQSTRDVEMADVYLTPTSTQTIVPPTAIPLTRSTAGTSSHSQPPSRSSSPQRHLGLPRSSAGSEARPVQRRSSFHVRPHPYYGGRSRSRSNSRSSQSSQYSDI